MVRSCDGEDLEGAILREPIGRETNILGADMGGNRSQRARTASVRATDGMYGSGVLRM